MQKKITSVVSGTSNVTSRLKLDYRSDLTSSEIPPVSQPGCHTLSPPLLGNFADIQMQLLFIGKIYNIYLRTLKTPHQDLTLNIYETE